MFLKSSISTTKKLFQKTLNNVKYLFSGGYQKIPKSPRCCDKFYVSTHWDKVHNNKKKKIMSPPPTKDQDAVIIRRKGNNYHRVVGTNDDLKRKEIIMYNGKKKYEESRREERSYLVAQKLKELKMLENYKDDEHALDIEQVLYYYSRLTCPAYVQIVDKFFMEMYSELFGVN